MLSGIQRRVSVRKLRVIGRDFQAFRDNSQVSNDSV